MLAKVTDKFSSLWWKTIRTMTPRRIVHSRGLSFSLACDNWITNYRWRTFNSKEPETLDWIDNSLSADDVLFDIGANVGVYSLYAALRHPGLRVIAFEPEYSNLHQLRDNIAANNLQNSIEVYSIGLSDDSGLSHLYVQDLTPGAALHSESKTPISETNYGMKVVCREGIWAMRLDDFVKAKGLNPTAIKIDVDGTEKEILEGAAGTIASALMRSLLIELPGAEAESLRPRFEAAGLSVSFAKDGAQQCRIEVWDRKGGNSELKKHSFSA